MIKVCQQCSNEFEYTPLKNGGRIKIYCSQKCCHEANKKPNSTSKKICQHKPCSKEFIGNSNKKYCSNTCRTYASHGNDTVPGWRARTEERRLLNNPPKTNIVVNTCQKTGIMFVSRWPRKYHPTVVKASSTGKSYFIPVERVLNTCLNCDKEFKSTNRTPLPILCPSCSDKEQRRIAGHNRRAKKRGVLKELVVPFRVMLRDNWTCQICGVWTPRELRGSLHDCAPEIDHKIPLSKGGIHAYRNVHCACRKCNAEKSDTLIFKYVKEQTLQRKFVKIKAA